MNESAKNSGHCQSPHAVTMSNGLERLEEISQRIYLAGAELEFQHGCFGNQTLPRRWKSQAPIAGNSIIAPAIFTRNMNMRTMPMSAWN